MLRTLRRRSLWVGFAAVLLVVCTGPLAGAAPLAVHRVFYLDLKARQCGEARKGAGGPGRKTVLVVPCTNRAHNLEAYAVLHGGWGHANPPTHPAVDRLARSFCLDSFQRRFRHAMRAGYGYEFFFPDAGAETSKYGDRFICSLILYPSYGPMGAGTHFR